MGLGHIQGGVVLGWKGGGAQGLSPLKGEGYRVSTKMNRFVSISMIASGMEIKGEITYLLNILLPYSG